MHSIKYDKSAYCRILYLVAQRILTTGKGLQNGGPDALNNASPNSKGWDKSCFVVISRSKKMELACYGVFCSSINSCISPNPPISLGNMNMFFGLAYLLKCSIIVPMAIRSIG